MRACAARRGASLYSHPLVFIRRTVSRVRHLRRVSLTPMTSMAHGVRVRFHDPPASPSCRSCKSTVHVARRWLTSSGPLAGPLRRHRFMSGGLPLDICPVPVFTRHPHHLSNPRLCGRRGPATHGVTDVGSTSLRQTVGMVGKHDSRSDCVSCSGWLRLAVKEGPGQPRRIYTCA